MSPGAQSRLIKRLLREQDEVLDQLDALNLRIEQTLQTLVTRPQEGDPADQQSPEAQETVMTRSARAA